MIATAVFGLVLLLISTAVIQVGRMFYKGVTMSRVQDITRSMADDIGQSIQFGTFADVETGGPTAFAGKPISSICFGQVRYSYSPGLLVQDDITHGMWKDRRNTGEPCDPVNITQTVPNDGSELLGPHVRITSLNITSDPSGNLWFIHILLSYGSADLFTNDSNPSQPDYLTTCKGGYGSQFCGTSIINTSVVKRL